jgi:signal transduction histidine kinase
VPVVPVVSIVPDSARAGRGSSEVLRLDEAVQQNLVADLCAQVALLVIVMPLVRNYWLVLLWLSRWVVIGAIVSARRSIHSAHQSRAVVVLCLGHAFGVITSCVLLPELGPLAMLVLVGDLSLLHHVEESLRRKLVAGLLFVAGIGSGLCLQSWTNLAGEAAKEVVVLAIVLHTIGSGIVTSQSHRNSYLALADTTRRLFGLQDRINEAIVEARQHIATGIIEGPVAELSVLHRSAIGLSATLAKGSDTDGVRSWAIVRCTEGSAAAQHALKTLRSLSHGTIPDLLRKHGLPAALVSLFEPADLEIHTETIDRRFEPWLEGALYMCAAEAVRFAEQSGVNVHGSLELMLRGQDHSIVRLRLRSDGCSIQEPLLRFSQLALDRLGAIGAVIEDRGTGSVIDVAITAPVDDRMVARQTNESESAELASSTASSRRILQSFVTSSLVAALAGCCTMAFAWAVLRSDVLGYIALCMAVVSAVVLVARVRLRRDDFEGCVAAMCFEIFGAALFVTVLEPRAAPITGLITTLPLVLGLPYFSLTTLRLMTALQIAALSAVMLLSFVGWTIVESSVPFWFLVAALPPVAAGVAFLVADTVILTIDETQRAAATLRSSLQRVVSRADAEQQAIERDLHDGAQQQFVAISMQFRVLSKLIASGQTRAQGVAAAIVDQLRRTREELLAMAGGSSPDSLRLGDLRTALMAVASRTPERIRLEIDDSFPSIPPPIAKAVYYCCLEAVQNAFKYSGDHSIVRVAVSLDASGDGELDVSRSTLRFAVVDDGVGFDTSLVDELGTDGLGGHGSGGYGSGGYGLASMRSRIDEVGGTLDVRSENGKGTTVSGALRLTLLPDR